MIPLKPQPGAYTAIVTPFQTSTNRVETPVAEHTFYKMMQRQVDAGMTGIVVLGCTGYDSYFTPEEHLNVFQKAHLGFRGRTQLIAGDGSNTTREAIALARGAEEKGIMTHLSVSPYKVKPSNQGLIEHYAALADSIEGDIILYSVPGRTGGMGILPSVAEELARYPQIIGIKEASGNLDRIKETIDRTKAVDPNFLVYSGNDSDTLDIIRAGGDGVISVVSNLYPHYVQKLVESALAGNYAVAEEIDQRLAPVYNLLFPAGQNASPNPVLCYTGLEELGIDAGIPPLPLTPATEGERQQLVAAMRKFHPRQTECLERKLNDFVEMLGPRVERFRD